MLPIAYGAVDGRLVDAGADLEQLFEPALHILHDKEAQDARQRRVVLELMSHHAGSIDAGDDADHRHEADDAAESQRSPELHVIAGKCLPDDRPHPRQLLKQVHIRHHQNSQNAEGKAGCEDAAQAPHGAGDELRGHKLCFRHRQSMHQIALPAQQVAVEPLHDGHDGDDHGADDDGGVDKAQQAHESRIGVTIGAVPSPD